MKKLQKTIISHLKTMPEIDVASEINNRIGFLVSYLEKNSFLNGFVLGISGGQDSTLTGKLAQLAINILNEKYPDRDFAFVAVRLPYGSQFDEDDCQDALQFIQPTDIVTVNIKKSVDASFEAVSAALGLAISDFNKGNVKARHRMEVQYSIAAAKGLAVLGTDHSAEAITGFYTKFGDGAADLTPIFGLNKRQGKMLLSQLNCPTHLYLKTPTADLEDNRPALPDEEALGTTYEAIDAYLEGKPVDEKNSAIIEAHYLKTEHKRRPPITIYDDWWK